MHDVGLGLRLQVRDACMDAIPALPAVLAALVSEYVPAPCTVQCPELEEDAKRAVRYSRKVGDLWGTRKEALPALQPEMVARDWTLTTVLCIDGPFVPALPTTDSWPPLRVHISIGGQFIASGYMRFIRFHKWGRYREWTRWFALHWHEACLRPGTAAYEHRATVRRERRDTTIGRAQSKWRNRPVFGMISSSICIPNPLGCWIALPCHPCHPYRGECAKTACYQPICIIVKKDDLSFH